MFFRDELIRQKRLARQQKSTDKQEGDFIQTQQEIRREKLRNTRIRLSIDPSKTWEDIKREEEIKRKDRVEKRKEELLQASHCSESLQKSIEKWKTFKSSEADKSLSKESSPRRGSQGSGISSPNRGSKGSGISPEEVTANLKRKQEKWEAKMKQQKLLLQASKKEVTPDHAALELERRHLEYAEKWKRKAEEKKAQEEMEKRKREEEERKRREKIIRSNVPDGSTRLTKAAEERVKAVSVNNDNRDLN